MCQARRDRKGRLTAGFHQDMLVYDILRTTSCLQRFYADLFERRGITYQQYDVIRMLRGASLNAC